MTANKFRGEYPLKVGEKTYTLRYGTNALVSLSESLGCKTILEIGDRLSPDRISFRDVRTLLKVALERHHPEITEADAGELIDEMGGVIIALELIPAVLDAAFPDKQPGGEGGDPNGQGAAGSGTAS
jgi:hypothetical protein